MTDGEKLDLLMQGQARQEEMLRGLVERQAEQHDTLYANRTGLKDTVQEVAIEHRNKMRTCGGPGFWGRVLERAFSTIIAGSVLAVLGWGLVMFAIHNLPR